MSFTKKCIAATDFTHGRQSVQVGDPVYFQPGEVNLAELRGLIKPGSAEDVDPDEFTEEGAAARTLAQARADITEQRAAQEGASEADQQAKRDADAQALANKNAQTPANQSAQAATTQAARGNTNQAARPNANKRS